MSQDTQVWEQCVKSIAKNPGWLILFVAITVPDATFRSGPTNSDSPISDSLLPNLSRAEHGEHEEQAMRRTRRNHAAGFKAKVALAAFKGDKTPDEFYFDNLPALPKAA